MARKLRFPDWLYGGPYLRVSDPENDLPRRDPRVPISFEMRESTELNGVVEGERYVAPFRDGNTLEEILGCIDLAQGYRSIRARSAKHIEPERRIARHLGRRVVLESARSDAHEHCSGSS